MAAAAAPITAFPPLHAVYEHRCVDVATALRAATSPATAPATTAQRDELSATLRNAIDAGVGAYADLLLEAIIAPLKRPPPGPGAAAAQTEYPPADRGVDDPWLLGNERAMPPPVAGSPEVATLMWRYLYREINTIIDAHYAQEALDPQVAAWLAAEGVPANMHHLAKAWLCAHASCTTCGPQGGVRDVLMPPNWMPSYSPPTSLPFFRWKRSGVVAFAGAVPALLDAATDAEHRRGHGGSFESFSMRAHMSLELLAHQLAAVLPAAYTDILHRVAESRDALYAWTSTMPPAAGGGGGGVPPAWVDPGVQASSERWIPGIVDHAAAALLRPSTPARLEVYLRSLDRLAREGRRRTGRDPPRTQPVSEDDAQPGPAPVDKEVYVNESGRHHVPIRAHPHDRVAGSVRAFAAACAYALNDDLDSDSDSESESN